MLFCHVAEATEFFASLAKFRYASENSISLTLRNFCYVCENSLLLQIAPDLHSASKFTQKLQKLMQGKLEKITEKQKLI